MQHNVLVCDLCGTRVELAETTSRIPHTQGWTQFIFRGYRQQEPNVRLTEFTRGARRIFPKSVPAHTTLALAELMGAGDEAKAKIREAVNADLAAGDDMLQGMMREYDGFGGFGETSAPSEPVFEQVSAHADFCSDCSMTRIAEIGPWLQAHAESRNSLSLMD